MMTKEERAEWKRSKELAKEARAEEKAQKLLDRFGVGSLSHPEDVESIRKIAAELSGTGLMELGSSITLGGGKRKGLGASASVLSPRAGGAGVHHDPPA